MSSDKQNVNNDKNDKQDGNISSNGNKSRSWIQKEMDEAQPYPLPEIPEDKDKNDEDEDKNSDDNY